MYVKNDVIHTHYYLHVFYEFEISGLKLSDVV